MAQRLRDDQQAVGRRPRERGAFWTDSAKLRPIDIASPTDFIDVVSSAGVPGNFSKVKRGIFVTT